MDDEAVAKIYKGLAKDVEDPNELKLLNVALQNSQIQVLMKEYWNGYLSTSSEEGWSVLQEVVKDRVQLMKEGAAALQGGEEGDLVPGEDSQLDEESLDEPTGDEALVEAFSDFFLFINPKSTAMLRATSAYFGRLANLHPEVVQFREEVLEGKILTPDEAHKLLRSYAARFLPLEWFRDWAIPLVGHTSEIVGEYDWGSPRDEVVDHRVTIRVDPPGITERVRYAHPDTPTDEDQILARCEIRNEEVILPYSATLTSDDDHEVPASSPIGNMGPALVSGFHTPTHPLYVWPGSVVDSIYTLSDKLADTFRWPGRYVALEPFRWWREDAAAEFVLTGIAPLMRPLEARLYKVDRDPSPQWRIELSISPWISAQEVVRAYRRMQNNIVEVQKRLPPPNLKAKLYKVDKYPSTQWRIELSISPWASAKEVSQAYKRKQEQVLGEGRNRLPDPKTLEVGRFVREQERLHGNKRPKWSDLFELWNKEHPEDQCKSHNNLCTYFLRADAAVKGLNFDWP
jgi:hypothetical protein